MDVTSIRSKLRSGELTDTPVYDDVQVVKKDAYFRQKFFPLTRLENCSHVFRVRAELCDRLVVVDQVIMEIIVQYCTTVNSVLQKGMLWECESNESNRLILESCRIRPKNQKSTTIGTGRQEG